MSRCCACLVINWILCCSESRPRLQKAFDMTGLGVVEEELAKAIMQCVWVKMADLKKYIYMKAF